MTLEQSGFDLSAIQTPESTAEEEISAKKLSKQDFSFTADDVLKELRQKKIEYIGTATSDFQAQPLFFDEKGNPKVMSDWEFLVANNLKQSGQRIHTVEQTANLPHFLDTPEEYIKRNKEIGMNMFRFSLDFARLCPEPGKFDERMMNKYVKALSLIKAHGQEPMLALYHWTMPKYLLKFNQQGEVEAGGWENPDVAKHFKFYIENVIKFLGDDDKVRQALKEENFSKEIQDKFLAEGLVKYFLTINEPTTLLMNSYVAGIFPPFKKGQFSLVRKIINELVEAHDMARNELKGGTLKNETQVGLAHNWTYFDGLLGKIFQKQINENITRKFEREGDYTDFLALQYYCRATVPSLYRPITSLKAKDRDYSDHPGFGDIYPPGIYEHLTSMNKMYPGKEIFITEFGFPDKKDERRPYWILETLRYVIEAKKRGVPIKGMLQWSLVNNLEWEQGMDQKLGLFSEDELKKPLQHSTGDEVRGWEAWQAVAQAIANPTQQNIETLQKIYDKAKIQFEHVSN